MRPENPQPLRSESPEVVVPLHSEDLTVSRKTTERQVRVHVRTTTHDHVVDEPVMREMVEIKRVAIDQPVDAVPPVRQEGDTTIIPVVKEVLVVERRLVLTEELHVIRARTTERHRETVTLREQQAVVERAGPGEAPSDPGGDLLRPNTPQNNGVPK